MIKKIILSTDIGTDLDDALAVYSCIRSPDISLAGVYVTNGDIGFRAKVAGKILRLSGYKATIGLGESAPLTGEVQPHHMLFESEFLSKREHSGSLKSLGVREDGLSALEEQLDGNTLVASIAPLTTLARLIQRKPEIVKKIPSIYIMGGREGDSEHNFRYDVEAAKQVLDSGCNLTLVPADVCDRFKINTDLICGLRGSPIKKYLAHMANVWRNYQEINALRSSRLQSDLEELERLNPRFAVPTDIKQGLNLLMNPKKFADNYHRMADFYKIFKAGLGLRLDSEIGRLISASMRKEELKNFGVSDVYVIYSLLHPDRTQTTRVNVQVGNNGVMTTTEGDRHNIITDLDYQDFEKFLIKTLQ